MSQNLYILAKSMLYNCMKVVSEPNQPNQWLQAWILIKSVAMAHVMLVHLNCIQSLVRSN